MPMIREKGIGLERHQLNIGFWELLGMISWKTGRSLQWDGANEKIVDDPQATALMQRPYRGPGTYPQV